MTIPQEISAHTSRIDPITHEVIRHRLWSINAEGSTTIIHASGSPVVHATDYNFGIYTSEGDIAVTGVYYMIPMYAITLMIRKVIEKFGDNISPGDVFITNDPFTAAVHQNDVQFVAPFFYQDKLIAWTGCMAHILDMGGMEPGSWCPKATDCYQEGLLIPVSRIVKRGTTNQALWELILMNTRTPFFVANDFSAFLSAHRVTHTRLQEVCDRYGADALSESMRTSIRHSEQQVRKMLTSLPDGTFEHAAYLDHDGHANNVYRIACKLTKSGDHLVFNFSDTDPQIIGMGNATRAGTWGSVATMMLSLFGSGIEWNAGLLEPVTILFGDKTALSAEVPSPISGGSVNAAWIALVCVSACIAKMFGFSQEYADYIGSPSDASWSLAQFAGLNQYGEPFATMYMDSGGWGGAAFRFRDGINTGGAMLSVAGRCNDVEQQENTQPFLYLWRRELPDSGGAGRFRGGNGLEYSLALHNSPFAQGTLAVHGISLPHQVGMFGGYPGSCAQFELVHKSDWRKRMQVGEVIRDLRQLTGDFHILEAKSTVTLQEGDVLNFILQNAGGYGDPIERDPQYILQDVRQGHVTLKTARHVYGTIVEHGRVNQAATQRERQKIRERRLADLSPMSAHGNSSAPTATSDGNHPTIIWGDTLTIATSGDTPVITCTACGTVLGLLQENWRATAPCRHPTPQELGPHLRLDDRFRFDQFVCPGCARSLWLDVQKVDKDPTNDFSLAQNAAETTNSSHIRK